MSLADDIGHAVHELRGAGLAGRTLTDLVDHAIDEVQGLRKNARRSAQALRTEKSDAQRCRAKFAAVWKVLRAHDSATEGDLAAAVGVALSRASRSASPSRPPESGDLVGVAVDLGALTNSDVSFTAAGLATVESLAPATGCTRRDS